jgi:hypothetical protein
VLPGPDKHSRPHSTKTTAIFEAFTATDKKIFCCMIFQSTTTIKNNKHIVWGRILSFLYFCSPFWIKHYTNFLNLTKFVSQHLFATHAHFHLRKFLSANNFLYDLFWVIWLCPRSPGNTVVVFAKSRKEKGLISHLYEKGLGVLQIQYSIVKVKHKKGNGNKIFSEYSINSDIIMLKVHGHEIFQDIFGIMSSKSKIL